MPAELSPIEHESALIDAFVIRERRDRYRSQLASRKKRGVFLDRLNHRFLDDIDHRFVTSSPGHALPSPSESCYVIASEDKYDSTLVSVADVNSMLADALFGILVSYIPGKLVAYKDEAPADIVWLSRDELP